MKKVIRAVIIFVFIILAVLTFVSRTVYNRNLPRVSTVRVTAGFVPLIQVDETIVTVPGAWRVVYVADDSGELGANDLLFRFDTRAYELERRTLELTLRRLAESPEEHTDPFDAYEAELITERLALLTENAPPGYFLAPAAGHITRSVVAPGRYTNPGHPLLVLRNETEERGDVYNYVLPRGAVFYAGNGQYIVYAIHTRRGLFGPEDYIRRVSVEIIRENIQSAAIRATDEGIELDELTFARDIYGWVNDGDTVWVRER